MAWAAYHHPDLSPTVLRRRGTEVFLDLLATFGSAAATWGRSVTHGHCYPSRTAYDSAVSRLRKKGIIAYRREGGKNPVLRLTEAGESSRPEMLRPKRFWNRKWNGIWYVLVYDIPETERSYRAALRGFMRRMRMGCLQGSVWVTPDDIRPEYCDLAEAGGLNAFAFLFEARTVLGQSSSDVVLAAWDMDNLIDLQTDYLNVMGANLERLRSGTFAPDTLVELAGQDTSGFLQVMRTDPLLPRPLWPDGYLGPHVLEAHQSITRELRLQMR